MNKPIAAAMIGVLVATVCGILTGCEDRRVMAPGAGEPDPLPAHAYPKIAALEDLDDFLAFGEPIVKGAGADDKPMLVTVPLAPALDRDIHVQYRFEFFDASKSPLPPQMDWQYMQLQARAQQFVQGSSLDPTAVDWRLLIRPAR